MFIMHIALQGCLRARNVDYGLTGDTGGHIKYLLELVAAAEKAGVDRQDVVVRRFDDERLGPIYGAREERISRRSRILRIDGDTTGYLPKEELWPELATIARNLIAAISRMDRVPDVIHAHYADAGWVGAEIRERLGIPLVFTGHSLGRVKALTLDGSPCPALQRRIAIEERAIARADRIVTSSTDEAEGQYALYENTVRAAARGTIRVNPPGCDLSAFGGRAAQAHLPAIEASVSRFLSAPDKPALLALARPVAKKNLAGLVEAYAASPELQAEANLVIFAGSRGDLADEEPENAAVLRELLLLVDRHDLWGRVALPKRHEPAEVPAIYEWARARRGVFVNTAFNEPFGLTFLEAAAAGLPVVATVSGGPNDILGTLENGILVDPLAPQETSDAALRLIGDRALWDRCSANARERVGFYGWARHARDYLADLHILSRVKEKVHTTAAKPAMKPYPLVEGLPGSSKGASKGGPVSNDTPSRLRASEVVPRT